MSAVRINDDWEVVTYSQGVNKIEHTYVCLPAGSWFDRFAVWGTKECRSCHTPAPEDVIKKYNFIIGGTNDQDRR